MDQHHKFTSPQTVNTRRRISPSIGKKRERNEEQLTPDQPQRRSKRRKPSASTNIPTTPAPPSSIRASARLSSRSGSNGRREYTGSRYNLEEVLSKRAPSSPHRAHDANATGEKQGEEPASDNGPRYCYCDEYCQACTSDTTCQKHDGFYCSGCEDWFHATCTGWEIIDGDSPGNRFMVSQMYHDLKIPLGSLSQEDSHPWYCIRCWETQKFEASSFIAWDDCTLEQKAFRLGVEVDTSVTDRTMQSRIDKYVSGLGSAIQPETLQEILGSHPRPFPTPKPMDPESRRKHALHGRRFELQMLQISIDTCSCCGRTKPFGTDPWMGNIKWISQGNFNRAHLLDPYHDAYQCDCESFCKGKQFYCFS